MNDAAIKDRPLLEVSYMNRRVLASCVVRRPRRVDLFVPAPLEVEDRTAIRLRVTFGDTARNFYIGGRATPGSRGSDPGAGYFVAIEESADLRAFSHLWSYCSGLNHEQARRFAASIPCVVRTYAGSVRGRILDLSMSGAFVAVGEPDALPAGASVELRVRHGFLPLLHKDIRAHLVWHGEKAGTTGIGAEFADGARAGLDLLRGRVYGGK